MFLKTKRLIIRQFLFEDFDEFASLMADKEVMRFSINGPLSREQAKEAFEKRILNHYATNGYGLWALVSREEDRLIGVAGLLTQVIEGEQRIELGYRLYPKYWGKGLATEANRAIIEYAFDDLGLENIISIIDPANTRSLAAAKRLEMEFEKVADFHGIQVQIYKKEKG